MRRARRAVVVLVATLLVVPAGAALAGSAYLDPGFGDDGLVAIGEPGGATAVAIQPDGRIVVGGWRTVAGQLGDGTSDSRLTPAPVPGLAAVVAVSADCSLALKADGTEWSSGWNLHGQLGDGTTIDRWSPVPVALVTDVASISGRAYHRLAPVVVSGMTGVALAGVRDVAARFGQSYAVGP